MTRKTLVMWSGGLDSTYGLVRLLKETDDEVYAHHISRIARDDTGRVQTRTCEYEDNAVRKMRPYIEENYRPFHYSVSGVNISSLHTFARDTSTSMFFAAQATKSFGFTMNDRILLSMNSDEDKEWNPGTELYPFLRSVTIRLLKLCWQSEEVPQCFLWPSPPNKKQEADYLPLELYEMTASCRNPAFIGNKVVECGICPECVSRSGLVPMDVQQSHLT